MSLTGEQLTENYQLLEPAGLREGKNLCLWRQINQDIHFPVQLKVDEGTIACFSASGKILEWLTPGEYYLEELKMQDPGIVLQETAVGWDKLRLYYFTRISECEIKMRSDIAAANMVIQCRIIDEMLFWSHFLKASYCQLKMTDIISDLRDRLQKNLYELFYESPSSDYWDKGNPPDTETVSEKIEEYIRNAPCFSENGLAVNSVLITRFVKIPPKKYTDKADCSEEAEMEAIPLEDKAPEDDPYLKITVRECHAINFRKMSRPVTKLCGFIRLTNQNRYFYLKSHIVDKLGIYVLKFSKDSVTIKVTPHNFYSNDQEPSKYLILEPDKQQVLYSPFVFDAGYTYLIEYKIPVKGKFRGILRWVFMKNYKREG